MNEESKSVVERTFEVLNKKGMHARAAALLAQTASKFTCDVTVARDEQSANAKSVMGVLLLCGSQGTLISVKASGPDAQDAVDAIGDLFANRFGEPE